MKDTQNKSKQKNLNNPTITKYPKETIFEEATKKLKIIEKGQKDAEKYFKSRDATENKLKLLESNLKKKVFLEKRANNTLEEKTLDKISIILKNISELDLNVIKHLDQTNQKKNAEIQTDQEDIKALTDKILDLEKDNENLLKKKTDFKSEIELLKTEISQIQNNHEKINKELKNLQVTFEEVSSQKSDMEIKLKELTRYNENLLENVKKHDKLIKEYNDLKIAMEDNIKVDKEKYDYEENKRIFLYNENKGNIMLVTHFDLMNNITQFLSVKDFNNLFLANKGINYTLKNSRECMSIYYNQLLSLHKSKIFEFENYDLKKEYKINDNEVEKLFKE